MRELIGRACRLRSPADYEISMPNLGRARGCWRRRCPTSPRWITACGRAGDEFVASAAGPAVSRYLASRPLATKTHGRWIVKPSRRRVGLRGVKSPEMFADVGAPRAAFLARMAEMGEHSMSAKTPSAARGAFNQPPVPRWGRISRRMRSRLTGTAREGGRVPKWFSRPPAGAGEA